MKGLGSRIVKKEESLSYYYDGTSRDFGKLKIKQILWTVNNNQIMAWNWTKIK